MNETLGINLITADEVERMLSFSACIPVIRDAMIAFSADPKPQQLRSVVEIATSGHFGVMPGRMSGSDFFGAKLVSVFPDGVANSRQRHQGIVVLFEGATGAPICIADAEAITTIRTAAATAVATEALARADARHLAIFGCGTQARAHLEALTRGRSYDRIRVWGRSRSRAEQFAREESKRLGLDIIVEDQAERAAGESDVLCTVTNAAEPFLKGAWINPGTHINLVGSSIPGPSEVDSALVQKSRYFVDSAVSARAQAAEFLRARASGLIDDAHILAEIGEVLDNRHAGRENDTEITVYKSLGLVVQDLAVTHYLHDLMTCNAAGADAAAMLAD
ncbi:MAG TPA: ornithine cyclodeaminase family protein [Sphingobium sp.]